MVSTLLRVRDDIRRTCFERRLMRGYASKQYVCTIDTIYFIHTHVFYACSFAASKVLNVLENNNYLF